WTCDNPKCIELAGKRENLRGCERWRCQYNCDYDLCSNCVDANLSDKNSGRPLPLVTLDVFLFNVTVEAPFRLEFRSEAFVLRTILNYLLKVRYDGGTSLCNEELAPRTVRAGLAGAGEAYSTHILCTDAIETIGVNVM